LALDRPSLVERLALLACPALALGTSGPLPLRMIGKPAIGRRLLAPGRGGAEGAMRLLARLGESRAVVERAGAAFTDLMVASVGVPRWTESWIGLLGNSLTLTGANPRWALGEKEVGRIEQPVVVAWGSRDPFGSLAVGRRFVELAGGRLLETEGAGHLPWLDEPAAIAVALDEFISHPAGAPALATAV
jgi:pimeloyl-ACP methyl ester carboxylesterase